MSDVVPSPLVVSTNVRSPLGALGPVVRLLARVAPGATARALVSLFLRTTRTPPSAFEATLLDDGAPFSVPLDGVQVRGWTWGEGPVVYLVHGWNGSATQLAPLAVGLAAAGFRAVAFDAPGHGATAGSTSSVVHIARALLAVASVHGPARAVVAHSLGSAAVGVALRRGLVAERVVMVAPAVEPIAWLRGQAEAAGLGGLVPRLEAELTARVGFTGEDVSLLGNPASHPLLVLHDTRDRETPISGSEALVSRWPRSRLVRTTGLGHRRTLAAAPTRREILGFVRSDVGEWCAHGSEPAHCPTCGLARGLFERADRAA
jgi:pimeloyl-ACP methyl ester carboxylesterase